MVGLQKIKRFYNQVFCWMLEVARSTKTLVKVLPALYIFSVVVRSAMTLRVAIPALYDDGLVLELLTGSLDVALLPFCCSCPPHFIQIHFFSVCLSVCIQQLFSVPR